uniref:Small ribosomal subunit protein uS10c n=1 Tax=Pteridomonas danica TaxID=38822 RepID=A0A7T1FUG1_9STRA|nr:ribosomal protein S10 [Pteridomonas danica]QPM99316.1 ribosomal protein S10 [Pteridomonas danica]
MKQVLLNYNTIIIIKLQSFNITRLIITVTRICAILKKQKCNFSGPISLPTKKRKYCLLKSPHINKTAREHFEIKIYKKILKIFPKLYINLNFFFPSGVDLKIFKI